MAYMWTRVCRIQAQVPVSRRCGTQRQKQSGDVSIFWWSFPVVSFILGSQALKSGEKNF